jgi:hypothetical protein
MNDKNRRGAGNLKRRTLHSADNEDKASKPGSRHNNIGRNSARSSTLDHENVHNLLQTPKEMLVLQRTLKGVLDWQRHTKDLTIRPDQSFDDSCTFGNLVSTMDQCLYVCCLNPFSCEKIMTQLGKTSAKLQSRIGVICTPLAILDAIEVLSNLTLYRNGNQWYQETSRFLVNTAVEAFADSHPSLLLLHLLFSEPTPSQLAMVREVGSDIMQRFYGEAEASWFRVAIHIFAFRMGLGATFESHANALCATTTTDPKRLYGVARLYRSMGQYEKSGGAVRRCLAQIEDEGDGDSSTSIDALHLLASVQSKQNDSAGEEKTLQKLLKFTLARDRRELSISQFSMDALEAISGLEAFYADRGLIEQRDALHLEYPGAFEL